ncbi:hypothetical protein [Actinoplanes utahensis]|uniref:hypothetical protein n=1 Tax=Actinoplanes utahensis TaxID=1869 RepID=UPI000AC51192|nr:hypothetical protein [Actinoplanes utahensis]GIF33502.1 hypothetical protein Aut01nite_64880 [Actinoplanes utahensis]
MSTHHPSAGISPHRPPALTGRRASTALLVVLFASFMDLLDVTIVTVAAPGIAPPT